MDQNNLFALTKAYMYNAYAELGFDYNRLTPAQHDEMAKAVMHTAMNVALKTSKEAV